MIFGMLIGNQNGQYGLFIQKLRFHTVICTVWVTVRLLAIHSGGFPAQRSCIMILYRMLLHELNSTEKVLRK